MYAQSTHNVVAAPVKLLAKQCNITTSEYKVAADVKQYEVCYIDNDVVKPLGATGASGRMVIAAAAATNGETAPFYTTGEFNHEALVWDASVATFDARREAFATTQTINVHQLPL